MAGERRSIDIAGSACGVSHAYSCCLAPFQHEICPGEFLARTPDALAFA